VFEPRALRVLPALMKTPRMSLLDLLAAQRAVRA
jgi:hypothetical protein